MAELVIGGVIGAVGASAAPWPVKAVLRLFKRGSEKEISCEQHIDVLRRALDKMGIRQSGTLSACDMLVLAIEIIREAIGELPAPAQRAVLQAQAKLASTVRQLDRISGGDDA